MRIGVGNSIRLTSKPNRGFSAKDKPNGFVRPGMETLPGYVLVTDMNTGHGFTKFGTANGTYTDDATTGYRNSKSFQIRTDGGSVQSDARKTTTSIDATNKILFIAVKFDDISKITNFDVTVGDSGLTNRRRFANLQGNQGNNYFHSGDWMLYTIPWQAGTDTGTVPRNAITTYQIRAASNGNGQANVNIGAIGWFDVATQRKVTISFDDGYAEVYSVAWPHMQSKGLKGTIYVPVENIGLPGKLTITQIKEMVNSGVMEVGYHGPGNDQRVYTTKQLRDIIETNLKYWSSQGISVKTGAYPGGEEDEDASGRLIRDTYAEYFGAARMINQVTPETIPPADTMRCRVTYVTNAVTTAAVSNAINDTIVFGGWHHQVYHNLVASGANVSTSYLVSDFYTNCNNINTLVMTANTVSTAIGL